jgi:hypothetical protein
MDFGPSDFQWLPIFLEQQVSDDPSFEGLVTLASYDPRTGRLGSNLHTGVTESDDDTDNSVLLREEVRIDVPLPPGWTGADVPVDTEYTTNKVDQQFIKVDDEAGFSDLEIGWKSIPYIRIAVAKSLRVYAGVLASGVKSWNKGPWSSTPTVPTPTEQRSFLLKDVKVTGQLSLGVGIEHSLSGHSNDYTYEVRSIGDFTLKRVSVVIG